MAQKIDLDSHAPGTALSAGMERAAPGTDRTLPTPDASPRDTPKTPPDPTTPARATPKIEFRAAETIAAPVSPSSPVSSDRLAQLAAHLPRVERDTYSAGHVVAKGGIGRIRSARDQRLDRPVALKELLVWNEAQEQRFLHEALLTARLQHPAIVPIYEAGRWPDGEPFYAMKLVSGRSLADLIAERGRLEDRLSLLPHVLTVAQAVAYAHGERILHRDLKPANVLVGELGETFVIDWGLAKSLAEKDRSTTTEQPVMTGEGLTIEGAVVGTPAYMPPEQASGEPVDERADVYALGAMLYHLLAAVPPYHETPWEKLLPAITDGPPRRIDDVAPSLSDDLCAIVNKAMARDPARRYPTAKDLADDLDRFLTGRIVAAHAYTTGELARRFWSRNRTALSIALTAIALLALVLAYAFVETDRERRFALAKHEEAEIARRTAVVAQEKAEAASRSASERADALTLLQAQGALARDPNEALAWLKTLSPSFTDAAEIRRIAADAQARGISRAYRGHTAHVNTVQPIGTTGRFVTASDDKTLRIWDARTGESRVFEGHTDEVWVTAVSPDETRVASASKDSTVRIWDLASGEPIARADVPEPARKLVYRKDGVILGCPGGGHGTPWAWDPGATDVRFLVDRSVPVETSTLSENGLGLVFEEKDGGVVFVDLATSRAKTLGNVGEEDNLLLSPDARIAVASPEMRASSTRPVLWKTDTGESATLPLTRKASHIALSRRGDLVIAASAEAVEVYDVAEAKIKRTFPGHGSSVYQIALSGDATRLSTGGYDKTVRVLDLTTGEARSYSGLRGVMSSLTLWPDDNGTEVLASSSAGDVRRFEPGRAGTILTDHHAAATGLAVSADSRVATVDETGALRITDLEGHRIAEHAIGPSRWLRLVVSPDGRRFAGGTVRIPDGGGGPAVDLPARLSPGSKAPSPRADGFVVIGTFDSARPTLVKLSSVVRGVRFSPTSDALFAPLGDGSVQRIDLSGAMTEIDRSSGQALALAVSPDGKLLAAGFSDGAVRLTDLTTLSHREITRHKEPVTSLDFSRDGALLATGAQDHLVRIHRLSDGSTRTIEAGGSGIRRLQLSADSKTLYLVSSLEAVVRRWSVETGEPETPFTGHGGGVRGFVLSASRRRLLTFSDDRTARLCDADSARCRTLAGHEAPIVAAAFAPGDKLVLTLDDGGVLRAWPDDLPESLPELRAWLDSATPDRIEGEAR